MIHGILEKCLPIVLFIILFCTSGCPQKHQKPVNLADYERQVFSETGEDGVIEKIFEIIEPTHKFCVEFGATDGIFYSNSRNLILNHGWSSLLIEGSGRASELKENYRGIPNVKTLQAWVWPGNIEILFEENGVPEDFDFLVIDIDSNDYYVWRAIQSFRPKVVMIEVNSLFPPPQLMVIDYHPMNTWDYTAYHGASLQSLYNLAKKKGYELVYHTKNGVNAFFVDKQYFPRFGIRDNSHEKLFNPLSEKLRSIFEWSMGPDLELIPKGKEYLIRKKYKIKKKFIFNR
ncbi:MAG: hypothetical protein JRJ00_05275 [Deltaproteobacteria bacterium]|nr:hypothetical protein [Deltaproteobacteria bacterium]